MNMDTQLLIIQLLNQELRKADHRATLSYLADVKAAKQDFIQHAKTLGTKRNRSK